MEYSLHITSISLGFSVIRRVFLHFCCMKIGVRKNTAQERIQEIGRGSTRYIKGEVAGR